jgi:hypothetical protein
VACNGVTSAATFEDLLEAFAVEHPAQQLTGRRRDRFAEPLARALAESVGRSSPIISASAGFAYTFNPETFVFERDSSIVGQLYLESPDPLGRRRVNVTVSYQWLHFDTFEGKPLDDLHDTGLPILLRIPLQAGRASSLYEVPLFRLDLETHQATASVTYGVTDKLDVNLTLPTLHSTLGLRRIITSPFRKSFNSDVIDVRSVVASKEGVGDLLLRGKYLLRKSPQTTVAGGLILRLPTGEVANFQGTGSTEVTPIVYLSGADLPFMRFVRFRPYLNAGINVVANDVANSEGRWGIGLDCSLPGRATLGAAVLGRHAFSRLAPPGTFDRRRLDRRNEFPNASTPRVPLFGFEGDRPDFYDFSIGGRINLWRDSLLAFANVILPLNDDGFRSDIIPLVGIEATF